MQHYFAVFYDTDTKEWTVDDETTFDPERPVWGPQGMGGDEGDGWLSLSDPRTAADADIAARLRALLAGDEWHRITTTSTEGGE